MSGLLEFPHVHPEDARKFLQRLAASGSDFAPVPPGGGRFADIEEACEFALSQATRLPKWFQRLRHPRSVRLVIHIDKYQPRLYHRSSDRGEADTSPGMAGTCKGGDYSG